MFTACSRFICKLRDMLVFVFNVTQMWWDVISVCFWNNSLVLYYIHNRLLLLHISVSGWCELFCLLSQVHHGVSDPGSLLQLLCIQRTQQHICSPSSPDSVQEQIQRSGAEWTAQEVPGVPERVSSSHHEIKTDNSQTPVYLLSNLKG